MVGKQISEALYYLQLIIYLYHYDYIKARNIITILIYNQVFCERKIQQTIAYNNIKSLGRYH